MANSFHIVDFDACVICVGALMQEAAFHRLDPSESYHSMDARHEQVKARGEQLLNCSSVAVVGGGLVGIELAGDLAYFAKERKNASLKNIILVHSGRQLADREFTPAAAKMATKKLQHLGVEIILNEKVVERQNNEWTLQSTGKLLQVDQVVMTTGLSSNTAFLEKRHKTHEGSWIQVDSYFQVQEGDGKLWAIGDCCTALPNTGMAALENAKILAHNLKHSLNNLIEDTELMKKAKKPAKVYIATIGRKTGVARGVLTHTQFFFPGRKNKTLFLSHVQSLLEIE
jgi:NADH dehydrogenase FAD-containing subunit